MRRLFLLLAGGIAVIVGGSSYLQAGAPQQNPPTTSPAVSSQRALLDRYCVSCHNERLRTGGLELVTADVANVSANAQVWEKVVRKLRAGAMPPVGRPRPEKPVYDGFATWLETELDRAAAANPNPGRTEALHRLNRTEYQNAIRDLLALDVDAAELLPADDKSYGFDSIAGVLNVSPTLLERYLAAARKISRLALGARVPSPTAETFRVRSDLPQNDRLDGLPFGTRGGMRLQYNFPRTAEYQIKIEAGGSAEPHELEIRLDGQRVQLLTVGGRPPRERNEPDPALQVRIPVQAGPREVLVAFIKKSFAESESLIQPFLGATVDQPALRSVTIVGPFGDKGGALPGDTPSRRRIFVCRPAHPSDEATCAKRILSTLARRAYRRPVTDAEIEVLATFYRNGRANGDFEAGINVALRRLLVSPEFLFRIVDPPSVAVNAIYHLTDLDLASRLSFFLWSSIPDDELLDVAIRGQLREPAVLERQVRRMLADDRADAIVSNFAGQWLLLRTLSAVSPDIMLFPDFDESLRQAFQRETERFFDSIIREDRSVLDLLNANYTFVNERLARHYGIKNVYGSHFRRVPISDPVRGGLLGQGSFLTVTSHANRTAPVLRGKWILENILGMPPPPPPPNVPDLNDKNPEGKLLSMRERMAQHRANPVCASCHNMMDPMGLPLENFDAIGRWRVRGESNAAIDASGALLDGTKFDGPAGLRQALVSHPELFVRTLTEKLLTYALGRGVEHYDAPAVRKVVREAARNDYRFSSIIIGIVNSVPFQMRRSQS